jgi:NADPH2:quinone reductase
MYAVQLTSFGPSSVLGRTELPDPAPRAGQVFISTSASGVHLADLSLRAGEQVGPWPLPDLPFVLGREVAGTVSAVGEGVDDDWVGRTVAAHLGFANGGYATAAVTGVDALLEVPDGVEPARALAMVGTGRTAVGILEAAPIGASDVVLVMAAAGGLGALLVQAALEAGAIVIGAAGGPAKVERVRGLGVDAVADYDVAGWAGGLPAPPTVVLEGVGGARAAAAIGTLRDGGRLVSYGWASGAPHGRDAEVATRGITTPEVIGPALVNRPGGLRPLQEEAMARLAAKRWDPLLTRFPLAEATRAHDALAARRTVGKVVLET